MADIIRESAFGQIVRIVTRNRLLPYPEEDPDFKFHKLYTGNTTKLGPQLEAQIAAAPSSAPESTSSASLHEAGVPHGESLVRIWHTFPKTVVS